MSRRATAGLDEWPSPLRWHRIRLTARLRQPLFWEMEMALFKSAEERRIERDIKVRQGIRRIEKAIREQVKFADEFIRNARRAKEIGDMGQYAFIRGSLKKSAALKRMLDRQLLVVKNALLVKRQAEASSDFAQSMGVMSAEIGRLFGATDLTRTQAEWVKAMAQSQSMEERMGIFLDNMEDMAAQDAETNADALIGDDEVDAMIEAEERAEREKELARAASIREELDLLAGGEKSASK